VGTSAGSAGAADRAGLIIYRYGADLFYANADHFADEVRELIEKAPARIQWLVFDAEAIGDVDLSAAQTIRSLLEDLNRKGVRVVFGRVNRYLLSDMRRHRIAAVIGDGRIFPTLHEALDAIRADGFPTGPDATKAPFVR
jgi:sulfate permease, SulP family